MSSLPNPAGRWTLVTFTDDAATLAKLADHQGRMRDIRFVAVVSEGASESGDLLVLVDSGGRVARQFGVQPGQSVMLDGQGTLSQSWPQLPEEEALALYAGRPAMPSAVPSWLFPVLAAAVLVSGIGAWAWTHAAPGAPTVAPPPLAAPAPAAVDEVDTPAPAEGEAIEEGEAGADAPAAPGGPGGKRGKGGHAKNQVAGWVITPRDKAPSIAKAEGDAFVLSALPDAAVSACRVLFPLTQPTTVSAEWKLAGFTGKPVRAAVRRIGADGKPLRGPEARVILGRGKGTTDWKPITAEVTTAGGATQGRLCLDLDAGAGTVSIRNVTPGG